MKRGGSEALQKFTIAMMSFRCGSLTVLIGVVSTLMSLAVSLPYYDAFTYTNHALGSDDTVTETIWDIGNSPSAASPLVTNAAALTYPGLTVAGSGVYLRHPGSSSKECGVDTASFPMTGAGQTLYASFLLRVQALPPGACPLAYFDDNASPSGSFQGVGLLPDGRLTLHRNSGISAPGGTTTLALNLNTTYLIAFRYKSITNTSNDELALWINPPLGQLTETTPDLTIATGGSDRTALSGFFLKQDTSFTAEVFFDEVRLGTNWTDVTGGARTCLLLLPRR